MFKTVNPANNETIKEFPSLTNDQITEAIGVSYAAFEKFKHTSIQERIAKLQKAHDILKRDEDKYARITSLEMGKPISDAHVDLELSVNRFKYYIENGEQILKPKEIKTTAKKSMVLYQPLGPLYVIMPWNFPFMLPVQVIVPALLAGNTVIFKHAPNCPQSGLALEDLFTEAGFNNGEFLNVFIDNDKTEVVLSDPRVRGASFTGSTVGGKAVGEIAGRHIKKHCLELGGSDAFIVLDDANLDLAVQNGVASRLENTGQSCNAAKRFILHKSIANDFLEKLKKELENWKVGDPMNKDTKLGPIARKDLCDLLKKQVSDSLKSGTELVYGDEKNLEISEKPEEGNFFHPMIIRNPPKSSRAYTEELFGPVFSIYEVDSDEEAIKLANDSQYGLGGAVITENRERGIKIAERIDTGMMFVNAGARDDARVPFGGVKGSGYGRELGPEGVLEFTNHKLLWIE